MRVFTKVCFLGLFLLFVLTGCVLNTDPVAKDDSASVEVNKTISLVLEASDTEDDLAALRFSLDTSGLSLGTASLSGTTLSYSAGGTAGTDSLTFSVTDSQGGTATGTIIITVKAAEPPKTNTAPVAKDAVASVTAGETIVVKLGASDAEDAAAKLKFSIATQSLSFGTASLSGNTVTYTAGITAGNEKLVFTVKDSQNASDTGTLTISVTTGPSNNTPVAQEGITASVLANATTTITLAATDADDDALTYSIKSQPSLGSVTLEGKTITYTAGASAGDDSFEFSVSDGQATASASVAVKVSAPTGSASAKPDVYTALINTLLVADTSSSLAAVVSSTNILANDTNAVAVVAESKGTSAGGAVVITANGSFTYTPKTNFVGQDSFEYSLTDSAASPNKATVTLTVQEVDAKNSSNAAIAGNQKVIYVKTGASGGDGSSAKPYGTLLFAQNNSAVGDVIVLYSASTYAPSGTYSFQLKDHQKLLGQGADVVINGQKVLSAATAPVLRRPPGGESLPLYFSTGSLNDNNLVVLNVIDNVTIKGLTLDRAATVGGTSTGDGNDTGSGSAGIVMADKATGTIRIEDVTIRYPGGFGLTTAETDACLQTACTVPKGTTPSVKPVAQHRLVINNLSVVSPGNAGIASNDAISVSITNSAVLDLRTKFGINIESEHPSSVTITNNRVTSSRPNTEAFFFMSNNQFRNLPNATMTVTLSGNKAELQPAATTGSIAYKAIVTGTNSNIVMTGSSQYRNADSNLACTGFDDAFNNYIENNPAAVAGAPNDHASCTGVSISSF